jgi:hypothetical protein
MEEPTQTSVSPIALQPCIYRGERTSPEANPGDGSVDLICKAMGGKSLGRKGEDDIRIAEICNTCTIPQAAAFRPCLFLVPIKVQRKQVLKDYFICRWFYRLRPEQPDEKTRYMCGGCPYWFPMPPIELLRDLERAAQKMIDYHTDVWENPPTPEPTYVWTRKLHPPKSVWRRALELLSQWWGW